MYWRYSTFCSHSLRTIPFANRVFALPSCVGSIESYSIQRNRLDDEFYRETHLKEWNQERRKHDEAVLDRSVPAVFEVDEADLLEPTFHLQEKKDRKLARNNPQKYCADRCLTTGYCDAFEDFFNFSAQEVVQFCKECVLSEDEEPCDIPYDAMDEFLKKEDAEYRKSANKLAP